MLTDLDAELFPDDCEVVEIPPHNQHVYLIQKNGSTSLKEDAAVHGWQIIRNQELFDLDVIDVYLREPVERYLSGISTFVQNLVQDTPELDKTTCEILATRYQFLNRHYLPQWHWIVNLARFINPLCKIRFHPMDNLVHVTDRHTLHPRVKPLSMERCIDLLSESKNLEFWLLLDRILLGRCGQSLTWEEILQVYREHPSKPMMVIRDRLEAVRHVLR